MKSLNKFVWVFAVILFGVNVAKAQSSLQDDKAIKHAEVKDLINNKDYVFEATTKNGTINDTSSNHHRYMAISKDTLVARLPNRTSADPVKVSCTNYSYNVVKNKNGHWDVTIKPNAGMSDVKQFKLDIMPNGSASLLVIQTDKKSVVYNGYIKQEDY